MSTQDDTATTQSESQVLPSASSASQALESIQPDSSTSTLAASKESEADSQAVTSITATEDVTASLDVEEMDVDKNPTTNGRTAAEGDDDDAPATLTETRIPAKKDETLREFLNKMDDYSPIIPDAVTNYYLTLAGLPPPPHTSPHLARLIALAAQKFVSDIAADAYQYARIRASNTSSSNNPLTGLGVAQNAVPGAAAPGVPGATAGPTGGKAAEKSANLGAPRAGFGGGGQGGGQGRTVLTMEDLGMAVGEYGINVKRGEFYR